MANIFWKVLVAAGFAMAYVQYTAEQYDFIFLYGLAIVFGLYNALICDLKDTLKRELTNPPIDEGKAKTISIGLGRV